MNGPRSHGDTEDHEMDGPQSHRDTEFADLNRVTARIIGCAIEVHKVLGPGLLESIYESAMCIEFDDVKIEVRASSLRFRRTTRGICPVSTGSILLFRILPFDDKSVQSVKRPLLFERLPDGFGLVVSVFGSFRLFLPSGCCGFESFRAPSTSRLRLQPFPRLPLRSFVI